MYSICLHYHKIIANVGRDGIELLISKNTCNKVKKQIIVIKICLFPWEKKY